MRPSASLFIITFTFTFTLSMACSDDTAPVPGSPGGACLASNGCDPGLICISGFCVKPPEAGLCWGDASCASGKCPDLGTCPTCKDLGTCPKPRDAGTCPDAAPCGKCPDAGPCPKCPDMSVPPPDQALPDQAPPKPDTGTPGGFSTITWTTLPNMQEAHAEGAAILHKGKLWVLGPFGAATAGPRREVYDFSTKKWTAMAVLPTGFRDDMGMRPAGLIGDEIYVTNGHVWYTPYPDTYAFNTGTKVWSKKKAYPLTTGKSCAAVLGGKLWIIGGQNPINSSTTISDMYMYNPVADSWVKKASMATKRADLGCAAVSGKLYAAGGYTSYNQRLSLVESYDPTADKWTTLAPMPNGVYEAGNSTVAIKGRLVVIGGVGANNKHTADVQVYNPGTNLWTKSTPIKNARGAHAVVADGSTIYVIGGYGGGWRKDVEVGTVQ